MYHTDHAEMKAKALELVSQMTLEEKAGLCSGKDTWNLKAVERLGLPSILVSDGPHGLRKQIGDTDNLGIGDSVPAVCFPTASALACSFDRNLAFEIGKAMGEECQQEGVSIILGPGVNQKRSPLCGRNFEYLSEDPLVSGEMAASIINGVQSTGVGTSLKHFAVNNQEKRRMTVSAVIDERTLRETYLKAFEIAVKKGKPATVMCAYNRLNGEYCSENRYLLNDILRKEWGFEGVVVSDWGAVNDRALGVRNGLDLEMPGSMGINDVKIMEAVKKHTISEDDLNTAACRVTELILTSMANKKEGYRYDIEAHHELAVVAAQQSAVLLKNDSRILPGSIKQKAAVIGAFAKEPRYQGAGSSKLHPIRVDNAWEELKKLGLEVDYAPGYELRKSKKPIAEEILLKEACDAAKEKDIVYLFVGLTEGYESEGFDRTTLSLPTEHNRLIEAVAECNPNTVVILTGGAPVVLPWMNQVKAILLTYLGGEGSGKAVANLLLGRAVPCGKLAETWPIRLEDTPAYHNFPGGRLTVEYRESIFVGYRYYDTAKKPVLFPFGYGLSYSDFTYSKLQLDKESCQYGDRIEITFNLKNEGKVSSKETVFLFVSHKNSKVFLPKKELKEFVKISLEPGETKQVSITLNTKDFGYYNTLMQEWYAESGDYEILVASSAQDCRLSSVLHLISPDKPQPDLMEKAPSYYQLSVGELVITKQEFEALYGKVLPMSESKIVRPYDHNNTLDDICHTMIGKVINKVADHMAKKVTGSEGEQEGMISAAIKEMPFHSMVTSGEGLLTEAMMEGLLELLNGHYIKGIKRLMKNK